jgi:hypothetical protein
MVGKIIVKEITEHEDGSATLDLDLDSESLRLLVEEGITSLLKKAIDNEDGYGIVKEDAEQLEFNFDEGKNQDE